MNSKRKRKIEIGSKILLATVEGNFICKVIEVEKSPLINGLKFDYLFIDEVTPNR